MLKEKIKLQNNFGGCILTQLTETNFEKLQPLLVHFSSKLHKLPILQQN